MSAEKGGSNETINITESSKKGRKKQLDFKKFFSNFRIRGSAESGNKEKEKKTSGEVDIDIIGRWIYHCFTTTTTSSQVSLNQVFAPVPTLGAYYAISQTTTCWTPFDKPFDIDPEDIKCLSQRMASAPTWLPGRMFLYLRLIVDDSETSTVSARLMGQMQDILKQQILPSPRINRYLSRITGQEISLLHPSRFTTSIYATAGLHANWIKPEKKPELLKEAFAVCINELQEHDFVAVKLQAATVVMQGLGEAWWIPVASPKVDAALVFIRPSFLGGLLDLKAELTGEILQAVLHTLKETELHACELLLPCFQVESRRDLWAKWMKGHNHKSRELTLFPPVSCLWHLTAVSLGQDGISMTTRKDRKYKPLRPRLLSRMSKELVWADHRTFTARLDSPFLFLLCHRPTALPLIVGSYSGTPPAAIYQMRIGVPDRCQLVKITEGYNFINNFGWSLRKKRQSREKPLLDKLQRVLTGNTNLKKKKKKHEVAKPKKSIFSSLEKLKKKVMKKRRKKKGNRSKERIAKRGRSKEKSSEKTGEMLSTSQNDRAMVEPQKSFWSKLKDSLKQ